MRNLKILGSLVAALLFVGCAQVDADTYKEAGSNYSRDDGLFLDSSNNLHFISNGTTVGNITSGVLTMSGGYDMAGDVILENDEKLSNGTDDSVCLEGSGGTSDEDICWDLDGTNVVQVTSSTGVVNYDLGAVGTTITLANDQTIVSDTDNEIQFGDGTEDVAMGFGTADTVVWSSDTGVVGHDLGATGTTLTLANDQTIVSDTDNEIQFGDNSEDVSLGFGTADEVVWSTDTGVTVMAMGTLGVVTSSSFNVVTGADTLTRADCGKTTTVSAGIEGSSLTLPATATAGAGCIYEIVYIGASAAALVDISPNASDGIYGSCNSDADNVDFSGTDDADIGLAKATGIRGNYVRLLADGVDGYYVKGCSGIWGNN